MANNYKVVFSSALGTLGSVEFEILSELATGNCGVKSISRIKCSDINKEIELCREFYNYITKGISNYKIGWVTGSDPFWDPYEGESTRAIYILTGAVLNDDTPYRYPTYSTMQFCFINKLPHFDMMVNPVHPERKSAVYALCVGHKKRETGKKESV